MHTIKIYNKTTSELVFKSFENLKIPPNAAASYVTDSISLDTYLPELEFYKDNNVIDFLIINDLDSSCPITYLSTEEREHNNGINCLVYDTDLEQLFVWNNVNNLWETVGGGSGSGLGFYARDEGIPIGGPFTTLNVIGVAGLITNAGGGVANLFIPTPEFPSHFNTTDGNTNATISTSVLTNRHVPSPDSEGVPFKIGDWTAGTQHPTTNNATRNYTTVDSFRVTYDDGSCTFTCNVYDADGVSLLATHNVPLTGDYGPAGTDISLRFSNWQAMGGEFRVDLAQCIINLSSIIPDGGRVVVETVNVNATVSYTYTQELFYDPNIIAATVSNVTFGETAGLVVTRKISGVDYYTLGSDFTVGVGDLDYLNNSSYPTTQVVLSNPDLALANINLVGGDLTGWTHNYNNIDSSYTNTNWEVSVANQCHVGNTQVTAQLYDWGPVMSDASPIYPCCVNTYTDNSTRVYEDFRLETLRLESDYNTIWDNTQDLTSYDGGNGLQYQCSRLIYPQTNFQNYLPLSGTQPDYTGLAGNRYFYRRMWHTGTSHSNGLFLFGDYSWTETDITNEDLRIRISLNGTDWYYVNRDYLGGPLSNGDGCRINPGTNSLTANNRIEFTLGTGGFTSASTGGGWGIYLEIMYTDTDISKYLGTLQITNW